MSSPLEEASPEALDELFSRDPLQLSDDDVEKIVTNLRAQRERWEKAEKKPKTTVVQGTLSLSDLGL